MDYAIAVIDIGMTNKKVSVFDDRLNLLEAAHRTFPPVRVDGIETHDLAGMEEWFLEELSRYADRFPVKAVAVTAHGATAVCVDEQGEPCVPCVYYTHEPGPGFHREFFERFGDPLDLQRRTGTAEFKALINLGKGLYFVKQRFPEGWARTKWILSYPQYWGYRLTGRIGAEWTYLGCHTYLWDFLTGEYSEVARFMGILPLLPREIRRPWDTLGTVSEAVSDRTGLAPDTIVTLGIHDSNASLLPYFVTERVGDFVLNSTGTWCVLMNPTDRYRMEEEELGKVVFYNISAMDTPIKTAIFRGGAEYEAYRELISRYAALDEDPDFIPMDYVDFLRRSDTFILPELIPGSGQFPGSPPGIVEDGRWFPYEEIVRGERVPPVLREGKRAYTALTVSLVLQTLVALRRIGLRKGQKIFIEGGFRRNQAYCTLLSSALSDHPVYLSDLTEATSFGAAMTGRMALTGSGIEELSGDTSIRYTELEKHDVPGLKEYEQAWLDLIAQHTEKER